MKQYYRSHIEGYYHCQEGSVGSSSHEPNFNSSSLTTKSFIGNTKVKSYFQSNPEIECVDEVVNALQKDVLCYNSSDNVNNSQIEKKSSAEIYPTVPISHSNVRDKTTSCCAFYGDKCECIVCYKRDSSRVTKG